MIAVTEKKGEPVYQILFDDILTLEEATELYRILGSSRGNTLFDLYRALGNALHAWS